MEVRFATNFDDYVALMAENSPHALVMDWWRRLDLALRDFVVLKQAVGPRNHRAMEEAVLQDQTLGPGIAVSIRELRLLRNRVAHEAVYNLSSKDAAAYARKTFSVIASLGRRVARLEGEN